MRILPGNAQHIGSRHSQQDSFGFADPDDQEFLAHGGFLAVVCDGMGGMEQGEEASRAAVHTFLDAYRRKTSEESIPEALERATREANQEVVRLANELALLENMGTTLVAAAVTSDSFYYISVGDSALFLVNKSVNKSVNKDVNGETNPDADGGQLRMLNRPHVFANLLDNAVARGVMSRAEADQHPERESLTSYIGAEDLEEIDRNLGPLPFEKGDTILLATDGMFKTLEPDEISACLVGAPRSWPDALVARTLAKQYEHQDNVTVLAVTLLGEGDAETPPPDDASRTLLIPPPSPAAVPQTPPPLPPPPPLPQQDSKKWTPPVQEARPSASGVQVVLPRRNLVAMMLIVAAMVMAGGAAAAWQWYARHKSVHAVTEPPSTSVPPRAPGVYDSIPPTPPGAEPDTNARRP